MSTFVGRTGGSGLAKTVVMRDRRVSVVSAVSCPDCGVAAGVKCMKPTGAERGTAHPARRRMAVRAENVGGYDVADAQFARGTTPRERNLARERSGLLQSEIAILVGLSCATYRNWERGHHAQSIGGPQGAAYGRFLREWLAEDA